MDNVSHSLSGWALARAAGSRRPPGTTLALVLATNLPDIDVVLSARSDPAYLLFHRGITHSFVGLAALPLILALGLWWGYGGRTRLSWFCLLAYCGVALHLVYDVVTSWGTMLLYPFRHDRFALDWLFIVDLVTWALPLLAIAAAWRWPARSRAITVTLLAALGAYAASAGAVHGLAGRTMVRAEEAAGRSVAEAQVFPQLGAPLRWNGIAVAPPSEPAPRISRYAVTGLPPEPRLRDRLERSLGDPWVQRALSTRTAQAYLWWARVPVATVWEGPGETIVVGFRDLRFSPTLLPTLESWTPFELRLTFDRDTAALERVDWRERAR